MAYNKPRARVIGNLGEDLAVMFLMKRGFSIIDRNYTRKWGEIDIVCEKSGVLVFVEVKSVSCEIRMGGRLNDNHMNPAENLHSRKLIKQRRVIQTYLASRDECEWRYDAVLVYIDKRTKTAKIEQIENIAL